MLDGNVSLGVSVLIGSLLADGGDPAGNRGSNQRIRQQVLRLLNLGLLGFQLQLRLLQIDLVGLNLEGVFQFVRRIGPIPVLFQLGNLKAVVFNGGSQLLQLQLLLLQRQLQLFGIVGKELLSFGDIVALPDVQVFHHLVAVSLNLRHTF